MPCLICGEAALIVAVDGQSYKEGSCQKCGHYRITHTALTLLRAKKWCFDVNVVRKWIKEHQRSGFIPIIDSDQVVRLITI